MSIHKRYAFIFDSEKDEFTSQMMRELYNIHTKVAATDATKKSWSIHRGTCCILQMTDFVSNDTYIWFLRYGKLKYN